MGANMNASDRDVAGDKPVLLLLPAMGVAARFYDPRERRGTWKRGRAGIAGVVGLLIGVALIQLL
jgi:hypothetical protein